MAAITASSLTSAFCRHLPRYPFADKAAPLSTLRLLLDFDDGAVSTQPARGAAVGWLEYPTPQGTLGDTVKARKRSLRLPGRAPCQSSCQPGGTATASCHSSCTTSTWQGTCRSAVSSNGG